MSILVYAAVAFTSILLGLLVPQIGIYALFGLGAYLVYKLTSFALSRKTTGSNDVYQLDHAVLNVEPPKTMWLNMGYWKDTTAFLEACEALAVKLGKHAGIQEGDKILDVGCGCGESLLLWATRFRASKVTGVTSVPLHVELAKQALAHSEDLPLNVEIDVQAGDAVEFTRRKANNAETFDRVIALDCVYHFSSRRSFLKEAEAVLEFTGTIGLTDLLLPNGGLSTFSTLLLRIICYLASVPFANLVPQAEYEATLRELGFTQVEIEDITPHVFAGLAGYIERLGGDKRMKAALDPSKLAQYRGFARVLRWWADGKLRFVTVKAMKGVKRK